MQCRSSPVQQRGAAELHASTLEQPQPSVQCVLSATQRCCARSRVRLRARARGAVPPQAARNSRSAAARHGGSSRAHSTFTGGRTAVTSRFSDSTV
jgi:hypothetical protein